ncbi:hypothetical protein HS121_00845 [bacterium]|nr:hypothetical protein [bacterium]
MSRFTEQFATWYLTTSGQDDEIEVKNAGCGTQPAGRVTGPISRRCFDNIGHLVVDAGVVDGASGEDSLSVESAGMPALGLNQVTLFAGMEPMYSQSRRPGPVHQYRWRQSGLRTGRFAHSIRDHSRCMTMEAVSGWAE